MTLERCRSCGGRPLYPVLSLGPMPLANAFLSSEDLRTTEERFPLELVFCNSCSLVQITDTVPPKQLFGNYLYLSSYSETFLRHACELATRIVKERSLNRGSRVIEVASNDGYLLQYYRERGIRVLGIEPAANVARIAEQEHGIPTICTFFGRELAHDLRGRGECADVVHAHNVLAHVADLNGFVAGLRLLVKDDGLIVVEVPYVREMVERRAFDTIYHEHLCYFSLTPLDALFRRHGLTLTHVERLGIHGGSLRVFAEPTESRVERDSVVELLADEEAATVPHASFYAEFAERVAVLIEELRNCLETMAKGGRRIAAYGAAAKGTVLLNALKLEPETIRFVVDRNPLKQGRYVPGVRVPIRPVQALVEDQPDYVLLLAWNLVGEVLEQQVPYRRRGGHFVIPIPEVTII